jgi:hypothetical protein
MISECAVCALLAIVLLALVLIGGGMFYLLKAAGEIGMRILRERRSPTTSAGKGLGAIGNGAS